MSPPVITRPLVYLTIFLSCPLVGRTFKISGISPKSSAVTVWTDTTGADQNVRLNYTLTELFTSSSEPPTALSGTFNDLRDASFDISGLKSDTWYGLHMSIVWSWRGSQFSDPAHNVAFKTLSAADSSSSNANVSTNATADGDSSSPITVAARPIAAGFQVRLMNRLGERLRTPMDAYVTAACVDGQQLGVRYRFANDQPPQQTKDFSLNNTRLPDAIMSKSSSQWAVDACQQVCWSLFVNAGNATYVLDTQCANLTEVFVKTGSDNALWNRRDDQTIGLGDELFDRESDSKMESGGSVQKRSAAESIRFGSAICSILFAIVLVRFF